MEPWFCVGISSAEYKKLKFRCYSDIVQYVQRKSHFPVYLIKNSKHSYSEILLIIVLKLYVYRKLINVQYPKKV